MLLKTFEDELQRIQSSAQKNWSFSITKSSKNTWRGENLG